MNPSLMNPSRTNEDAVGLASGMRTVGAIRAPRQIALR